MFSDHDSPFGGLIGMAIFSAVAWISHSNGYSQAKADGQAKCAILKAESEAKSNIILSQSITTELIQWQAVQNWDGKLPQVTNGAIPFINLNK